MSAHIPTTRTPRTGRRLGGSSTREAILAAARDLFAQRGYEGATMRAIAAAAGVDAALVVHFFGTKAALLREAIEWPFDPAAEITSIVTDGRNKAGKHLIELFVRTWDEKERRNSILTLLRAASTEPQAANMLRDFVRHQLLAPLMARLGSDHPDLRASLAASQLVGLGIARYILGFEPLASAAPSDVAAWLAPTMQRYLTGKITA